GRSRPSPRCWTTRRCTIARWCSRSPIARASGGAPSATRSSSRPRRPRSAFRRRSSVSTPTPCSRGSAIPPSRSSTCGPAGWSEHQEAREHMAGILAAAASIPRYRLPRQGIAAEWGSMPGVGEKAVANHDEDSLTLAVNAALALEPAGTPDGVLFATTSSPYAEKQGAATIAAVLDLPATARTLDVTATLRAGTSAVLAAVDAVASGSATCVLVAAADCRLGEPESAAEQSFGDAGAALLVGAGPGIAEIVATHTLADDFLGSWRTRRQEFARGGQGAFEAKYGYARVLVEAAKAVLAKARVAPGALATVILPTPN